jgi:hypothetical protein
MAQPRLGSARIPRRPLGPGSVSAAVGGFLALLSLPLDWGAGCAVIVARKCESVNGFRGLGWRVAIPAACGLAAIAVAARLAKVSKDEPAPPLGRHALVAAGAITVVFCQFVYNLHPWSSEGAGATEGGWNFGPGLLLLALAGFLMFWAWASAAPDTSAPATARGPELIAL